MSGCRIMVMDQATGKPLQYAMEMGSVARSTYDGWKRDSVKPGDAVTVSIHPLKDGSRGGMYLSPSLRTVINSAAPDGSGFADGSSSRPNRRSHQHNRASKFHDSEEASMNLKTVSLAA